MVYWKDKDLYLLFITQNPAFLLVLSIKYADLGHPLVLKSYKVSSGKPLVEQLPSQSDLGTEEASITCEKKMLKATCFPPPGVSVSLFYLSAPSIPFDLFVFHFYATFQLHGSPSLLCCPFSQHGYYVYTILLKG